MEHLSITQKTTTDCKQNQQLLLSLAMKQAFHVLQMPVVELAEWLTIQIEQNPILECLPKKSADEIPLSESEENWPEENDVQTPVERDQHRQIKAQRGYQESLWRYSTSLFEHLMQQARLTFDHPEELQIAETLIGNLDERGFLTTPPEEAERHILKKIQTFDPAGIGAADVRESLLIQLSLKGKEKRLAYQLIQDHFDALLHRKIPLLQKKLKCSAETLHHEIKTHIAPLDPHPGYRFAPTSAPTITPDIFLHKNLNFADTPSLLDPEQAWTIEINSDALPHFQLAPLYSAELATSYLRRHITSAKWIHRIVGRRHQTLKAIAKAILKRQSHFLSGEQRHLEPMSMQEIAYELLLSESTIARAVANKYLFCPAGLFSLRSFFTQGIINESGRKVSNHTLRQALRDTIHKEDKQRPLSDDAIARHFKKIGFSCARRTITKYRKALAIPAASKRRQWH